MIRRGFWLTAGAVTGIYGYRRASAVGRRLSGRLTRGGPASPGSLASRGGPASRGGLAVPGSPASPGTRGSSAIRRRRTRPGAVGLAIQAVRFTRDVREGMELYMARHSAPAGSTLMTDHDAQPEDGR
jgi:hypothetical protein